MATAGQGDESRKSSHSRSGLGLWSAIRDFFGFKATREATSERRGNTNEGQRQLSAHEPIVNMHLAEPVHDQNINSDKNTPKSQPRDLQVSPPSLASSNLAAETNITGRNPDDGTYKHSSNYSSPTGGSFVDVTIAPQGPQPELTGNDHSDLSEALGDHSYRVGNPNDLSNEVIDIEKWPAFEGNYSTIYRGNYNGQAVRFS